MSVMEPEVYTSIEDLPLDDYVEGSDGDDSLLVDPFQNQDDLANFDPSSLRTMFAAKPLVKYLPYTRPIKQGNIGRDCYAVKRALSVAGFGKWGG